MSPSYTIKKVLVPLAKVLVAIVIIVLMVEKGLLNPEQLLTLGGLELLVCVLLVLICLVLSAFRWMYLLHGQGFDITQKNLFSLQLIGLFFNFVVPGGVGGDLVKGYYLVKASDSRKVLAATSIIMDRVIGLWSILILVMLSGPFIREDLSANPKLLYMYRATFIAGMLFTGGLLLGFSTRFHDSKWVPWICERIPYGKTLLETYEAVHGYCTKINIIGKAVVLSLGMQISTVFFFYIVGRAMNVNLSMVSYMFIVPLGFVASSLPITPGGIGIGQVAFLALFNTYLGTSSQIGPNSISLYQIVNFGFGLFGGVIYMFRKKYDPAH